MMRSGSVLVATGVSLLAVGYSVQDFLTGTMLGGGLDVQTASERFLIVSGMILLACGIGAGAISIYRRRKASLSQHEPGRQDGSVTLYRGQSQLRRAEPGQADTSDEAVYYFAGAIVVCTIIVLSVAAYNGG
jgi:uncharacterized membrane protein YidH (DUF202 family)